MEERRLILAILSISLAALATTEEDPNPSSTRIFARAPLPRPPPKPNNTLSQPQALGFGQCDLGTINLSVVSQSSASRYADAGRLYVDFGQPAQCTGELIRWEFCFTVVQSGSGSVTSSAGQSTITMAVLRREAQTLRIINVYDINIDLSAKGRSGPSEGDHTVCNFIDSEDAVFMEHGDVLGFVCGERVRIIFTDSSLLQGQTGPGAMIGVFNISSMQRGTTRRNNLLGIGSIQEDQFELINESMTPLLRVIMNATNETTSAIPTTVHPTDTPCLGNGEDIFRNTIFLIVLATASVVIFILLVLVFVLGCCICKMKFRCCYKLHSCCCGLFLSGCCKRNQAVVHRIKVEPLSVGPGLDQSMQYNELYVPSNPSQRDRMCRGELHKNPAYTRGDSQANGVDEIDRAVDSGVSEGTKRLDLEHTYEMIDTIR